MWGAHSRKRSSNPSFSTVGVGSAQAIAMLKPTNSTPAASPAPKGGRFRRYTKKKTTCLTIFLLMLMGYAVISTHRRNSAYLSQLIPVASTDWMEFQQDYQERFGRMPPDTLREWLRYARYYECNERDYYNVIEEDLLSFRHQVAQNGLFHYSNVIPSGLNQTDNYLVFRVVDNEIRTVASHNYHLDFLLQAETEKNLRWVLEPLKLHSPPLQTLLFFDLHDHPTQNSTPQSLPIFTNAKMGYITENQPPPKNVKAFVKQAFDTKALQTQSKQVVMHTAYHKDYPGSYDCRSLLVPYYFGLRAAEAFPWMSKFKTRKDAIVWRGGTTGYEWGMSPRFRLMDQFVRQVPPLPHPMPKGANPIVPGVDADFGFVAVVQNYTSNYTLAPNWRMTPFMSPEETKTYKYILDVDGNSFTNRFSALLRLGSVVFKSTRFREWFSERLQPWVDYIPVNYNYSDFQEKVAWIHNHPDVAERIVQHGKDQSMHHMRDEDMRCYTYRLVLEYNTLFEPQQQQQ